MKRDNHPFTALKPPDLQWRDNGTPYSTEFADFYFSSDDGLAESRHTFLAGNELPARWREFHRPRFAIAETGFGAGLNFLLTLQAWLDFDEPKPDLYYLSIENAPLTAQHLERALLAWPTLSKLGALLIENYPPPIPGHHRIELEGGRVLLDLHWGNALEVLQALAQTGQTRVDAWYLDGFAPARNSDIWSEELLGFTKYLSRAGTSFATFTAASPVRRSLSDAGFNTRKVPGFGRKREALRGRIETENRESPAPAITPWDIQETAPERPQSALVIGAGLAGCWTALALAKRGIPVTLLEQNSLASAGSGNKQGILYTRISHHHSLLVDFGLHSYLYATRLYKHLFDYGLLEPGLDGELCGSFQMFRNAKDKERLHDTFPHLVGIAERLDAATASERLGIELSTDGYWLANSGWLHPEALCRTLINEQPLITLQEDCGLLSLVLENNEWHAIDNAGIAVARAASAVIATGTGSTAMAQTQWLPLRTIRGQTTDLAATAGTKQLRAVLCHEGYIAPAREGVHCVGASFNLDSMEKSNNRDDHRDNLNKLSSAVPSWKAPLDDIDCDSIPGNVGFRCASLDYLPTVGPVPDTMGFSQNYAALRENAKQVIDTKGSYLHNLYLTAGHGSRGLTSTPICAELLASIMCNEPLPLERDICRALSPARFIIRDLVRDRKF